MQDARPARFVAFALVAFTTLVSVPVFAQVDFSGEWATRHHEDSQERGPGGELGDYTGLPLNDAARLRADSWDAALYGLPEWQCRPHAAYSMWRSVHPVRIWKDVEPVTGETTAIHANFQDLIERVIYMDGRPHPPDEAAHTWAGFSTGKWEGDMLTVTTTHLKEYMIRRDGVPISDLTTMTEHWIRHDSYLTIVQVVTDPVYLTEPFIQTTDFVLDPHIQDTPELCETEEETDHPSGWVPHRLPGTTTDAEEFAKKYGLPVEAVRGGAETMYPEYRKSSSRRGRPEVATCAALGHAMNSVEREVLTIAGRELAISNPSKVLFPQAGYTKLDLACYYVAVSEGALRGAGGRPNVLVRYPDGIDREFFFQKRAPRSRPSWIDVVSLRFPSGRSAEEVVPRDGAALVWMANLACLELHPHPVRADDLEHPDELRVDLDPVPGIEWSQIRTVAGVVHATLDDFGLVGWPKTSGSRGMHVYVRIERRWTFDDVRRAALALAREVERRAPDLATSKWWKEERHGVFLDYNQNAKDRTIASAYSVRPTADARVSAPLAWDEIDACEAGDFTLGTMPSRVERIGDRHAAIDQHAGSLAGLLELSDRQLAEGQGDAPWPPHYRKQPGEGPRVTPSRRRTPKHPLIEIARAREKPDALAGLERWKARHGDASAHLVPSDVLVDAMRGRFRTWTRIRINLQHVPKDLRPEQEPLDPNDLLDDLNGVSPADGPRRRPSRARRGA